MNQEQLQAIRERVNKATPGPWIEERDFAVTFAVKHNDYSGITEHICHMGGFELEQSWANGQFIAHAREDVPALLDEIERLRGELEWFADSDNYTEDRDEDGYHAPLVACNGIKRAQRALAGKSV